MKKGFFLASVMAVLSMASCNKNETAAPDTVDMTDSTEAVANMPVAPNAQDDLLKEAQANPVTTIALSENHFDFGQVKKGEKVEHVYEVTNTGKNPLIINAVQPGCGCTAPDYTKDPILPGAKGTITLSFDSTNFDGKVDKFADVYANVENAPVRLTFTADVQP